jgi:hypothetical protein
MKYRKWLILAGVGIALVAAILITPLALAQRSPASAAAASPSSAVIVPVASGTNPGFGPYAGFASSSAAAAGAYPGGYLGTLITVAASKIGIRASALTTDLQNGQTIAQVAAAHNVATSTIANAFIADVTAQLKSQVSSGQITQTQANTMLADLKTDVNTWLTETNLLGHCPGTGGSTSTNPSSSTSTQ